MYNSIPEIQLINQYLFNHKKTFNIEIGNVIKEIRKKKNISTELMANRTLMSPSYITQLEKGINGITLNKFVIICNALEVAPKEILDDFLFYSEINETLLYNELQKDKNISLNILNFIKEKRNCLR